MSEDVFRIVVTAAVAIAAIAFVGQAVAMVLLYRAVRKVQRKAMPVIDRAGPVMDRIGPMADRVQEVHGKHEPVIEELGPMLESVKTAAEKTGPVLDRASRALATAQSILNDNRANISGMSGEALAIARTGRQQAERLGELINDASERARFRLEQIDQSVDNTVEQVEHVGAAVKRAAMRPVREAGGLAAGISAAVSTLVHGRKYEVDHATQDEEMFI